MPRTKRKKPTKPYQDFPLTAHANGQWCKKIRNRVHFFGVWDDPDSALQKYLDERDDLQAGRDPRLSQRLSSGGMTLKELWNRYLHFQQERVCARDITERFWLDLKREADRMLTILGRELQVSAMRPEDFSRLRTELSKQYSPVIVKIAVSRIRSLFSWAFESELIEKPVRYGKYFEPPAVKVIRRHRRERGLKLFSAAESRRILQAARPSLRAMFLLALNCGFGNTDCSSLPQSAVDLERGWVDWPRPKTEVNRRCPLWPETVASLREAIAQRPAAAKPEYEQLVFLTRIGEPWVRLVKSVREDGTEKRTPVDSVLREFSKVLHSLGIHRDGLGFYAARHTFRTVADEIFDRGAIDHIMGHSADVNDMRPTYVERIDDSRLLRVSEHVRKWLFDDTAGES